MLKRRIIVARNTVLLGALLTILGAGTYALSGYASGAWPVLLPAVFGLVFLMLGTLAQQKDAWGRPFVVAATALAVVVFVGTVPGLFKALALVGGAEVARPVVVMEQGIMAALCLGFLGRSGQLFAAQYQRA